MLFDFIHFAAHLYDRNIAQRGLSLVRERALSWISLNKSVGKIHT